MPNIEVATKSDKKAILRFYKEQHYSASFLGFDTTYLIKLANEIVATVIVSQLTQHNTDYFLHGLVVDERYQHRGLASKLISYCQQRHSPIICFSQPSYTKLYQKLRFIELEQLEIKDNLSAPLYERYIRYLVTKPNLGVMMYVSNSSNCQT